MALLQLENRVATEKSIPLLRLGFRPFFLLAGISAVVLMLYWLYLLHGGSTTTVYGVIGWHAHEMLFGYTVAVIAGFLLTATKNWTNVQTLHGAWLGGLVLLWLAARIAPWLPLPAWLIAAIDLCFLPLLAVAVLRPLLKSAQYKQLIFVVIVLVLFAANVLFHLGYLRPAWQTTQTGVRLAWMTILFLITVMGGLVIPFFIERGTGQIVKLPASRFVELASVGSLLVWMLATLIAPEQRHLAFLSGLAGLLQLLRWWRWHLAALWRVPMLWILYLGYAWIPIGLFLYAYTQFTGSAATPALHAFTAGTIGMLTIGMMARVSLGHTGREIRATRSIVLAFILVALAALVRVLGAMWVMAVAPGAYNVVITLAGALWALGFVLFVLAYFPILSRARIDQRPG